MSKIKLFIATSLDGYIARNNGSLDWLPGSDPNSTEPSEIEGDGGYMDFIAGIDTVFLGKSTYESILGFGIDWPYADFDTFVFTSNEDYKVSTPKTQLLHSINKESIESIKKNSKKDIWIVGGGSLFTQLLALGLVDEMTISLISTTLGEGIKLFQKGTIESKFRLVKSQSYGAALVSLTYEKK